MAKTIVWQRLSWVAVSTLFLIFVQFSHGDTTLVEQALGPDDAAAKAAIEQLRGEGPAGVAAMLAVVPAFDDPSRPRWERALDAVCAQRDCAASGLFWHTNLDAARAEAERTGKPILSLRLLGRLDEEASCANSRFFRTILYPDPRIEEFLKNNYVLHWQSVRPVPRVSIDFGDGRVLNGTITGNSIHYVLDQKGRLVDALPGLYGPGMFLDKLERGEAAARRLAELADEPYLLALRKLHAEALLAREQELTDEGGLATMLALAPAVGEGLLPVRKAERLAMTKAATQMPLVNALSPPVIRGFEPEPFDWQPLAERHWADWRLSFKTRMLVARKHLAATGVADGQEGHAVAKFERLVGLDSVRNEYLLHTILHSWLAMPLDAVPDLTAFNDRVYEQLFLTPRSDPWLGLMTPETFLALAPDAEAQMITR